MINSGVALPLSRPGRSSSFSMVACPDEKQWVLEQAPPPVQERIMASWNEDFLEDFLSSFIMGEQSIPIPSRPANGCQALEEVPKSPHSFGEIGSNSLEKVSTAGGQTERKRKRRRFYDTKDENGNWLIPHVPLPRIPKSDIRREYAQLFSNVYNSGDNDLLRRFVGQMFPDSHNFRFGYGGTVRLDQTLLPALLLSDKCCIGKYYELCTGRPVLYQFSREHMSMAPDVVFSFEAARIKLRSDGTSALYGTFKITGNQVFRCPYEEKLALDDHQMTPSFRLIGNHITYTGSDIPSPSTDFPTPANEDTASPGAPSVSPSIATESSSTDTTLERDFLFPDATTLLTVPFSSPAFIDQPLPPMPVVSTINVGPHVVDVLPEDFILYPQPKVVDFELNGDFCMSLDAQALIDGMELIVTANLLNKEPVETHASRLSS